MHVTIYFIWTISDCLSLLKYHFQKPSFPNAIDAGRPYYSL
jgi:hypothetical protein